MKTLSQDNFILEVEKNIDAINKRTTKRALIAIGVVVFLVLLYGAVMKVDVTVKMITIAITPIPVIALIIFAYVDKAIRPLIEKELAESVGYNQAQMERVLKNPNYKEHSAEY